MFLAHPNRFAPIVIVAMMSAGAPLHSAASGQSTPPNTQLQTAPVKPSADVPLPASLPATQPTEASDAAAKPAPQQQLNVDFTDGKVTVDATNASLNSVLNDIAAKAEIRITGSVTDERVFGHYGPATPSVVLATLLDGTGSNMLLVDDTRGGSELVLTPRGGGPTPPNPATAAAERAAQEQDDRSASRFSPLNRPFQPGPGRGPLTVPPNVGSQFQVGARPGQPGSSDGDASDPAQSSNESKTPQQIYEQLQNQNQQKLPTQAPQQ